MTALARGPIGRPFSDLSFSIVGAGRVGVALGVLLKRAGHRIVGCSARTTDSLERAVRYLNCFSSTDMHEVYGGADCVIISVPDDALADTASSLVQGDISDGTVVLHTSGSYGLEPLGGLEPMGASIAAVHPLQSIPDVETGVERIPGSWFGVTCDDSARTWIESFVVAVGGKTYWVDEQDRIIYHAAAVIASNYLVTLGAIVAETRTDPRPYFPLMEGTLSNLIDLGPAKALTGPLVRGDVGTVKRHLEELERRNLHWVANAYRALAEATLNAAVEAGRLEASLADEMRNVIGG